MSIYDCYVEGYSGAPEEGHIVQAGTEKEAAKVYLSGLSDISDEEKYVVYVSYAGEEVEPGVFVHYNGVNTRNYTRYVVNG